MKIKQMPHQAKKYKQIQPSLPQIQREWVLSLFSNSQIRETLNAVAALTKDYPKESLLYNISGVCHARLDQLNVPIKDFEQALEIRPNFAQAHNNLGLAHHDLEHLDTSINCYEKALAINPDDTKAKFNLSLTQLLIGHFKAGWLNYESRWKKKDFEPERHYPQALWDGSSLIGKTLFLYFEQGMGDTIQFIRYVKVLSTDTTKIMAECPKSLHRLFSTIPEINVLLTKEETLPPFDFYAPLSSLPDILKTTLKTIPVTIPYLFSENHILSSIVSESKVLNIGIVWAGNPKQQNDKKRSINLSFFFSYNRHPKYATL